MKSLTDRQQQILDFITDRIVVRRPPSFREIGDRFGIASPNGVMSNLQALKKKGYLEWDEGKARTFRVRHMPHLLVQSLRNDAALMEAYEQIELAIMLIEFGQEILKVGVKQDDEASAGEHGSGTEAVESEGRTADASLCTVCGLLWGRLNVHWTSSAEFLAVKTEQERDFTCWFCSGKSEKRSRTEITIVAGIPQSGRRGRVLLGVTAPPEVPVHRKEIQGKIDAGKIRESDGRRI